MADEIHKVEIEYVVTDNTEPGRKQVEAGTESTSQKVKTETTKAGAAVGGLGDQFKKLSSPTELAKRSMGRFIEMFNPFNLAMGAAIGGIVALGAKLWKLATEDAEKARKKMEELTKATDELATAIDQRLTAALLKAAKIDADQFKLLNQRRKIEFEIARVENEIAAKEKEIAESRSAFKGGMRDDLKDLNEELQKYKNQLNDVADAESKVVAIGKIEARGEGEKPKGGTRTTIEKKDPGQDLARLYQEELDERLDAIEKFYDDLDELTAIGEESATQIFEENAARREEIWANEMDAMAAKIAEQEAEERAAMQRRMDMVEKFGQLAINTVNLAGKIAEAVATSEKEQAKVRAVVAAITAGIESAMEIARAYSAIAREDWISAAAHFVASATWIAAASTANQNGGGGAGGGSRGGGGYSGNMAMAFGTKRDEGAGTTTIIINGHIFSPKGAAGFVQDALAAGEDATNPGRTRRKVQ